MGKDLAIKGHPTRGKEIIELLKMLGGDNRWNASGEIEKVYYSISNGAILYSPQIAKDTVIFTLEEFLGKYPYKVGDKVQVLKSGKVFTIGNMIWDDEDCDIYYYNAVDIEYYNAEELKLYKETDTVKTVTNKRERTHEDVIFDSVIWHLRNSINNGKQYLSGGDCEAYFRELVKKVKVNDMESCKCPEYEDIKKVAYLSINDKDYADEIEVNLGDDYEYKFEMNRLYILKKKPKYPKTYEECYEVIGISRHDVEIDLPQPYQQKMFNLFKLRICRDAYWKIAGEEMGLDNPWEPDWSTESERKYVIEVYCNNVRKNSQGYSNTLLAFPTIEMRNAFYEIFKDLIERCKEFL